MGATGGSRLLTRAWGVQSNSGALFSGNFSIFVWLILLVIAQNKKALWKKYSHTSKQNKNKQI